MDCNYFEYQKLADKLFYGVALTDSHLNAATEQIRQYLVNGGAGHVVKALCIGLKVVTKESVLLPQEVIRKRFVWLDGERKGEELSVNEIRSIGMFLKYGAFYNRSFV